jgi:hypothetical protein
MSWWKKLVDPSKAQATVDPASEPTAPVDVEIIAGKLSARIYVHEIDSRQGSMPCWSYVTDGLTGQQQAELVFTLRRDPGEPSDGFPPDPLQLFVAVYQLAEQGKRVTAGSFTEFGDRNFFGHHLLYARAQPLAGVTLPPDCLAALLVTADELRAVREFGCTRVLARLGQASTYYPFPPWADRRRQGLSLTRTFEKSLLSKIPRASSQGVCVGVTDSRIIVSALRSQQASWPERLAQLPGDVPFALLTALDPTANGCLVWVPGQKGPEAITAPGSDGSRLCGCFIIFLVDQPVNGGKLLEDGFAMELTREAWQAIRRALVEGQELSIPVTGGGMSLALTWRDV